ncbi:MAG: c-type cytochrome [Pleurocapsa minor GSE-CHR-MK-17-07R]|nr:c-type cytochrome [Pleurocapsa minor GSE-CHR-MK 17-07R]
MTVSRIPVFVRALCCAALALALTACSGLGGEPVIVASVVPATPPPADVGFPVSLPDIALGAEIFAARCTDCHGINGAGDGPLVASGQVQNAGNFTDPASPRGQRPTEWFATVTNGRIENLMPPWANALTEAERWAVSYYTYTMHYTPEQLALGRDVYTRECAACHGDTGLGDGPDAQFVRDGVPSLLDQEAMALLSDRVIYNYINEGAGDPVNGMPAYADTLTEEERWAAAAYARALSFDKPEAIGAARQPDSDPAATPEVGGIDVSGTTVTLAGRVTNGTAGFSVPADLLLTAFVFDETGTPQQFETTVGTDGAYALEEIPFSSAYTYVVTAAYRDRVFGTQFIGGDALAETPLDITLYELTEDASVLSINAVVTQVNATANGLEIAQVFQFTNAGDRAYTTSQTTPDGRPVGVVIQLPPGAFVPGFTESNRYAFIPENFTVVDTAPVLPGEGHLIQLIYLIDYTGSAIIEQPLNYALEGTARLLVRPPEMRVVGGDQFPAMAQETIGQNVYAAYGADLSLAAGETLRFELSGRGGASTIAGGDTAVIPSDSLPLIVIAVIVGEVLLVGGLLYWYTRRRRQFAGIKEAASPEQAADIDDLVQQLAMLDADFEAGKIAQDAYERQRAALKKQLTRLMSAVAGRED